MPFFPRFFSDPPAGRDGLRAMRQLWGLGVVDLAVDLLIAWAVDAFYFRPNLLSGFFNVTTDTARVVFYVAAAAALVVGQLVLLGQLHRFHQLAREEADGPLPDDLREVVARQRWRVFLRLLFLGEFLGMAALVIFLATGSWQAMIFLAGAALVFDLQGFPRRAWWPEAADSPGAGGGGGSR